jgi:hypothetical protein
VYSRFSALVRVWVIGSKIVAPAVLGGGSAEEGAGKNFGFCAILFRIRPSMTFSSEEEIWEECSQ